MTKSRNRTIFVDILAMIVLILVDQFTKYIAVVHLKNQPSVILMPDILEFNYLENRGAAFGMLQNQKIFFIFAAITILAVIGYVIFKIPEKKKFNILHVLLVLIASGAIGNLIDRLRLDYVVDFISFVLINFPIFNMADIYVSVSMAILVILLLFYYKEEDLNFLSFKQAKYREIK